MEYEARCDYGSYMRRGDRVTVVGQRTVDIMIGVCNGFTFDVPWSYLGPGKNVQEKE